MKKNNKQQFEATDLGNAERFIAEHQAHLLSVSSANQWLKWNGHRWHKIADKEVYKYAIDIADNLLFDSSKTQGSHFDQSRKWH